MKNMSARFATRILLAIIATGCFANFYGSAFAENLPPSTFGLEKSLLQLSVAKRDIDIDSPWRKKDPTWEKHLAVAIGGGRFLTTAFAVLQVETVEAQRFGKSQKIPMQVEFADFECNLAVVRAVAADALGDHRPMPIGKDITIATEAWIYNDRNGSQVIRNAASLVEVNIVNATTSRLNLPAYMMKVQQSGLGWSEPVVRGGEIVGMTSGQDENHVYAIPASVIKHFLDDLNAAGNDYSKYRGFPGAGFNVRPLVEPNVRKMLKADAFDGGVRISEVWQNTTDESLLPNDVLLAIDNVPIHENGTYESSGWGRVGLSGLLASKFGGDTVAVRIARDGKVVNASIRLERFDSNASQVVYERYDGDEPHLIFGGLIFQELSRDYLREWGREWRQVAPVELLYLYEQETKPRTDGKRWVILNRVLADEFNQGYDRLQNQIVHRVNGVEVRTIEELQEALKVPVVRHNRRYAVFEFTLGAGQVVLGYDAYQEAQQRIAKTYNINSPRSFYIAH